MRGTVNGTVWHDCICAAWREGVRKEGKTESVQPSPHPAQQTHSQITRDRATLPDDFGTYSPRDGLPDAV